jgi:hypothetical protein
MPTGHWLRVMLSLLLLLKTWQARGRSPSFRNPIAVDLKTPCPRILDASTAFAGKVAFYETRREVLASEVLPNIASVARQNP